MSEPRQLMDAGGGRVAFVSEIDGSFQVGANAYSSESGCGLITGTVDTTGVASDILSMPNLILGAGEYRIIDVHKGPSGKILVLGAFTDSISIVGTVLLGTGTFLAQFTPAGQLLRADQLPIDPYNDFGAVVEGNDGTVYMALVQNKDRPQSILGEGLLLISQGTDGGILGVYDNGNSSFFPDSHPHLAAGPANGVYLAYGKYNGSNQGASINVLRFNATGEFQWENAMAFPVNSLGDASPIHLEATDGGVLVSGYSTAPLALPGLAYMQAGPNFVVYELGAGNELRWAIADNAGNVFGAAASMNSAGEVYATGWLDTPAQFGPHALQSVSQATGYINKIGFGPEGVEGYRATSVGINPNPASGRFHAMLPASSMNSVQLIDQQGRLVREVQRQGPQIEIDITGVSPGSYVVRSGSSVGRVIIQ